MQRLTLDDVIAAFDPIDRDEVVLPSKLDERWEDLDYLAWRHPDGGKAFMVVPLPERLVGFVLKMSTATRSGICDLCLSVDREGGAAAILVQSWARPRTSYGICVCSSLECSLAARGLKSVYQMGETISTGRRVERLQENTARFARFVAGLGAAV